ncbi:MAG: hypothetical protein MUF15_06910 [Acidobacteria bacterium]|jgi:hypothetical protein|nr:hypothetical protein [Acidobacteriota bacterium]
MNRFFNTAGPIHKADHYYIEPLERFDLDEEERIRRVLMPILAGSQEAEIIPTDDVDYGIELGLIKKEQEIRIANRIYKDVLILIYGM